jgi:Fe-S-cluster containining protein
MDPKYMGNNNKRVDVDKISTWTKHEPWLCETCRANCCSMPVEVEIADLIRMGVITKIEARAPIESLATRLKQDGVIEHLYVKERIFILARSASSDCLYLDPSRRTCLIYTKRPDTCREHPRIGARPGFCPYQQK